MSNSRHSATSPEIHWLLPTYSLESGTQCRLDLRQTTLVFPVNDSIVRVRHSNIMFGYILDSRCGDDLVDPFLALDYFLNLSILRVEAVNQLITSALDLQKPGRIHTRITFPATSLLSSAR